MKKIIIFFSLFLFADVSDIILKIKKIETLKRNFLKINYNIFVVPKKNIPTTTPIFIPKHLKSRLDLKIYAIFNNKVNINGKWYKIGDFVNGYKVIKIFPNQVILKKDSKIVTLRIKVNILKVK